MNTCVPYLIDARAVELHGGHEPSALSTALVASALAKRRPGDQQNPIDAHFNIRGWPNIAEQDCRIMLCQMGGQRVFQRALTDGEGVRAYRIWGASRQPFGRNQAQYGTHIINAQTTSAEDFPWRNIHLQPGQSRWLTGASEAEQHCQGGSIEQGYEHADPIVDYGDWFRIFFDGPHGPLCRALFQDPPDVSVCRKRVRETLYGTSDVDPGDYIYQYNRESRPFRFDHVSH